LRLDHALSRTGKPFHPMGEDLVAEIDVLLRHGRRFRLMLAKSDTWKVFLRCQAQTKRPYRRAIEEFERLKALRSELPNKPISEPKPEPAQPLEPPPDPSLVQNQDKFPPDEHPDPIPVQPTRHTPLVPFPNMAQPPLEALRFFLSVFICGHLASAPRPDRL
jgi:hypothetical protein